MMRVKALSVISAATLLTGGGVALAMTTGTSPAAVKASTAKAATDAAPIPSAAGHAPSAGGDSAAMRACPETGATAGATASGVMQTSTATHLFTRTTADGVTIRVYRLPTTVIGCGSVPTVNGPVDPPVLSCGTTSDSIEMSDDTAVGQGELGLPFAIPVATPTTPNAGTAPQSTSAGTFGVVEGDPVWWVAMKVGSDVATSQVTFSDGSTDTMAPVGGVVVLAHHMATSATSDPYTVRGTVQLLDTSGTVLQTITLPQPPVTIPPPVPVPLRYPTPEPPTAGGVSASGSGTVSSPGVHGASTGVAGVANTPSTVSGPVSSPATAMIACPVLPLANAAPSTPMTSTSK
jgi:hypothetical protein